MKISKEIKLGIIAICAIVLIVTGINFLKGSSFFGGDDVYYGYFPSSGGIMPASSVAVNGVGVGKVLSIEYVPTETIDRKVKVTFNIQNKDIKIPKGANIQIGSLDLFNKAIILVFPDDISKGYHKVGSSFQGSVALDMTQQVQAMADPVSKKLQHLLGNVDRMVNSINVLFDTTRGTNDIRSSLNEAKLAIKRFGNLSLEMNDLVKEEKIKLSDILQNVANITRNLDKSNKEISAILGNAHAFTDDIVKSNFKEVIAGAHKTISTINKALEETEQNRGNLSKFLKDESLYNDLVNTNKKVQIILDDLHEHPEKYIKLSVFSRKPKGLQITKKEEEKLRKILDSIP